MICIFGHGRRGNYEVEIGGRDKTGGLLTVELFSKIINRYLGLSVSTLMTSCFSGDWIIGPLLKKSDGTPKATMMSAAGLPVEPESWKWTDSLGRCCGSLYVSALIKTLEEDEKHRVEELEMSPESKTGFSTKEFADAIKSSMSNTIDPRFGEVHDVRFVSQGDIWDVPHNYQTHYPITSYKERFSALRTIPPRVPTTPELGNNQSVRVNVHNFEAVLGRFGGSMSAVRQIIRKQALFNMRSGPGRDGTANNTKVHLLIQRAKDRSPLLGDASWCGIFEILHYRLGSLEVAGRPLKVLSISTPCQTLQ